MGTGPHPCSHPQAPESWVQDPDAGYLPCPTCTGVTHMRVPLCLGVPIHVLWDAGQCLYRPSRALAERPALPAYCERRCLAGSRAVPEPCLGVCVSVWLPCCWPLPGIWAAQGPALPSPPAPRPLPRPQPWAEGLLGGLPSGPGPGAGSAHSPTHHLPPKLGRQENTRHSCAKVAAGRQAAGGGGPP